MSVMLRFVNWRLILPRVLTLLLFVIGGIACSGPAKHLDHQVPAPSLACKVPPLPVSGPVPADLGGEGACPVSYGVCLSPDAAVELIRYVGRLEAWASEVQSRCGGVPG